MSELNVILKRIQECESMGELEFIEDIFKKNFSGMDKVDFEIECVKKFQELRELKNSFQ